MGTQESRGPASNGNKSPSITELYHLENDYTFLYEKFNKMLLPRSISFPIHPKKQSKVKQSMEGRKGGRLGARLVGRGAEGRKRKETQHKGMKGGRDVYASNCRKDLKYFFPLRRMLLEAKILPQLVNK